MWDHHIWRLSDCHDKRAITSPGQNEVNRVNSFIARPSFPSYLSCVLALREGTAKLFHQRQHAIYPRDPSANDTKRAYGRAVNPSRPEIGEEQMEAWGRMSRAAGLSVSWKRRLAGDPSIRAVIIWRLNKHWWKKGERKGDNFKTLIETFSKYLAINQGPNPWLSGKLPGHDLNHRLDLRNQNYYQFGSYNTGTGQLVRLEFVEMLLCRGSTQESIRSMKTRSDFYLQSCFRFLHSAVYTQLPFLPISFEEKAIYTIMAK